MLAIDLGDFDNRNVEGPAAKVVHCDLGVALLLVHTVGKRRRRRLVDDTSYIETGDPPGVLGRLALRIVEIGRYRNDSFSYRFAEIVFGGLFHFHQHPSGDLGRRHLFAVGFDPSVAVVRSDDLVGDHVAVALHDVVLKTTTDQSLYGKQRILRICHRLALGRLSDEHLIVTGKCDDGRRRTRALGVFNNPRFPALEDSDARIGGSEIDSYDFAHLKPL